MKFIPNTPRISKHVSWNGIKRPTLAEQVAAWEAIWNEARRPYFHLWPICHDALMRTNLDLTFDRIPHSILHQLKVVSVKLPVNWGGFQHFMLCMTNKSMIAYAWKLDLGDGEVWSISLDDSHQRDLKTEIAELDKDDISKKLAHCAVGVSLLAADQSMLEPMILRKDMPKLTVDSEKELVEKAQRRGKFGWDIGRSIQQESERSGQSTYYQRGYYAIRWTGKGGKVPKMVFCKGTIHNREKLNVPTGYESNKK